jgi:hypothetical protein
VAKDLAMMIISGGGLNDPTIQKLISSWTPEERAAAALDVLRYGDIHIQAGRYVSHEEAHRGA